MERLEAYAGVDARDPAITLLGQGRDQPDKPWYNQRLEKDTMRVMTKGFWITPRQYLQAEKDLKKQIQLTIPGGINPEVRHSRSTEVQLWDLTEDLMEKHQWLKRERTPDNPTKIPMQWKFGVFARWAKQLAETVYQEEHGEMCLTPHSKRSLDLSSAEDTRDAKKPKTWEHARYPFYACILKICDIRKSRQDGRSAPCIRIKLNNLVTAWDETDAVLESISFESLKKRLSALPQLKMDESTDQLQWTQAFHRKSITTVIDSDEKLVMAIENMQFPDNNVIKIELAKKSKEVKTEEQ